MARFNEILVGRYNRFLQKLLSMKGEASLFQVSSELQPVLPFFAGCENRVLENWDRFALFAVQPAVAASLGAVQIRNPAGSNVLTVIESLLVWEAATDQPFVNIGATNVDLATIVPPSASSRLDPRGRPNPSMVLSRTSPNVAIGMTILQVALLAFTTWQFVNNENQEMPLLPGDAYQVSANTVNTQISVSLVWRERFLEDSERK